MEACNSCHEQANRFTLGCGGAAALPESRATASCSCYEKYRQCQRECCDPNGICCQYPASARDPYWPEFAHPRSLCCAELYNGK